MNRRLRLSLGLANRFRGTGIGELVAFEEAVHEFYREFYDYDDSEVLLRLEKLAKLFETQAARVTPRPDLDAAIEYYRAGLDEIMRYARLGWSNDPMFRDAITDVEDALRNVARRVPRNHRDMATALEHNADRLDELSSSEHIDTSVIADVLSDAAELGGKAWADEKYIRTLTEALNKLEVQYMLKDDA